jgi:hypothetical protein
MNLTKGTLYEVKVQGATRSITENSKLYRGEFSEPRKVILQSKCISKFYHFSNFPLTSFLQSIDKTLDSKCRTEKNIRKPSIKYFFSFYFLYHELYNFLFNSYCFDRVFAFVLYFPFKRVFELKS